MRLRNGSVLTALVLLSLAVSGCSGLGLVYNRLDTLVRFQIGRYVELDAPQRAALDPRLSTLWQWHRSTQLPVYAKELRELANSVSEPLTPEQLDAIAERVQHHAEKLSTEVLRVAAPTLASLSDSQIEAMLATIEKRAAKENRKQQKLSDAEWVEKRSDDAIDRLDEWAGSVTPGQRASIQAWAQTRIRPQDNRLAPQRKAFADLMQERHAPDFAQAFERYAMAPFTDMPTPKEDRQGEATRQLMLDLSRQATPEQRAHLRKRLGAIATELESLAQTEQR